MAKNERARSEHRPLRRARRNLLVDEMQEYSPAEVRRLFKLSPTLIQALAKAGYIAPTASEGKTAYSFQDILVLRVASALNAAAIPAAKITAAVGHIRGSMPPGMVLATMSLAASESADDSPDMLRAWASPVAVAPSAVMSTKRRPAPRLTRAQSPTKAVAEEHYSRGHALEDSDVAAARAAYMEALNAHSDHLEARINLGRLLHLEGNLKEAEKVYRQARTSSALLSFNLAILLEDLNREEEAVLAYRDALAQDPQLHDAHFNLSRLHEKANQPREALRHLLAYRRYATISKE